MGQTPEKPRNGLFYGNPDGKTLGRVILYARDRHGIPLLDTVTGIRNLESTATYGISQYDQEDLRKYVQEHGIKDIFVGGLPSSNESLPGVLTKSIIQRASAAVQRVFTPPGNIPVSVIGLSIAKQPTSDGTLLWVASKVFPIGQISEGDHTTVEY